jgi:hypothetical protein
MAHADRHDEPRTEPIDDRGTFDDGGTERRAVDDRGRDDRGRDRDTVDDRRDTHDDVERREPGDQRGRQDVDVAGDTSRPGSDVDVEGRWKVTQSQFLESPREAVAAADALVTDVIDDVRRRLDADRASVADTWQHDGASTEDLRAAMLRYREVLDRLGSSTI